MLERVVISQSLNLRLYDTVPPSVTPSTQNLTSPLTLRKIRPCSRPFQPNSPRYNTLLDPGVPHRSHPPHLFLSLKTKTAKTNRSRASEEAVPSRRLDGHYPPPSPSARDLLSSHPSHQKTYRYSDYSNRWHPPTCITLLMRQGGTRVPGLPGQPRGSQEEEAKGTN